MTNILKMSRVRRPAVYIMASGPNGTLYTGVTSDLVRRSYKHRTGASGGFASTYRCSMLVYFELFDDMTTAITREKQLKGGSRARKVMLIESSNPQWLDLFPELV